MYIYIHIYIHIYIYTFIYIYTPGPSIGVKNYIPSTFERNLEQWAQILVWSSSCYLRFLETRAFFAPCGPHRFHVPSGLKMRPVCVFLVHLCVTGSDWTQKYQPWGFECWLSCDAFQLVVAFVIANRAFLKKQGWSAHKPGAKRLQIRAKRAQIRANERTLKKGTTCIFRSALCSILIIMRAFGLTYFDVTNVWWPLCCLDYLKAARIWLYLRDYFSQGKACCWSICGVTGDVLTFQEILSMFLNIEHFECNKRTWQLAFFVSISTGHKFRYHLWVKVFIYTP